MDLGDLGRAGDLSFEAALTGVCTLLLLGCLGWLLLATSAAVLGEVVRALAPGSALADRVARGRDGSPHGWCAAWSRAPWESR